MDKIKDDPKLRMYIPEHWFPEKAKTHREFCLNVYQTLEPLKYKKIIGHA